MGALVGYTLKCDGLLYPDGHRSYCRSEIDTQGDPKGESFVAVDEGKWFVVDGFHYCKGCHDTLQLKRAMQKVEEGKLPDPSKDPEVIRRQSDAAKRLMREEMAEDLNEWDGAPNPPRARFEYGGYDVACLKDMSGGMQITLRGKSVLPIKTTIKLEGIPTLADGPILVDVLSQEFLNKVMDAYYKQEVHELFGSPHPKNTNEKMFAET